MGFTESRADPDLWIKQAANSESYEYIASHIDDFVIVSKTPEIYIKKLQEAFPIRNIERNPTSYLGNDLTLNKNKTMKVSMTKYINETIRRFEQKHGTLRKENVPHSPNDHPEEDDSPNLNDEKRTLYQSIIGVCQWISIAGKMDISFTVSSLSRFASNPR